MRQHHAACLAFFMHVGRRLFLFQAEDCFSFKLASFFQVIQSLDFFKQALSSAMPRGSRRSVRPARSGSTSASHASRSTSPPVSDSEAPTEASLLSCSTYDLWYRCTQAGLDSSGRKADLVARLLNQSASSLSSGSRSRSPPAPTRRLSEVMDESSLRQVIQTEVTACVAAAVQNLAPSLHLPTASATLSPNVTPHGSAPSSSTDLVPDLQLIAPTTTTTIAAALPTATVPARTVDRISRGEYIDLSDLLPEALGLSPSAAPLQLQLGDRGAVVQVLPDSATSSSRAKRHVHDFATWMEAWTAYLFVVLSAAPSRAPELVAYQAIITDANRKFHPDGWLAYDRQFRSAASLNKTLRWDVVEPTLWQLTMTGTKRQPCFNCQLPHPQGARCPFRASARQQSGFTRATHKGREVCYNFNFMRCSNRQCPRTHVCLSCGGDHPRAKCPRDPQRQTTSKQS